MALIKCKECSAEISKNAKTCPRCGAAPPKKTGLFTKVIASIFALGIASAIYNSNNATQTAGASQAIAQTAPANKPSWTYESSVDKMTSKPAQFAALDSINSLSLAFPYQGENKGRLVVQNKPRGGLGVYFKVDKGQLMCKSFNPCKISIRFDDKKPMSFTGDGVDGGDSTATFLSDPQRFIANAKTAKHIIVSITMYQAGEQMLEFSTDTPLVWK